MKYSTNVRGVFVLLVCLGFLGCGKRQKPETIQTMSTPDAQAASEDLTAINELVRDYVKKRKVIPKTIDELVTSGYMPSLPAAPPGKKFVIQLQPMGYSVVLANE